MQYTLNILLNYVNEHTEAIYVFPQVAYNLKRWKIVNNHRITWEKKLCILLCCLLYIIVTSICLS